MNKEEYYEILDNVGAGFVIGPDGRFFKPGDDEHEVINNFIREVTTGLTWTSSTGFRDTLLSSMCIHFERWRTDDTHEAILSNMAWLNIILQTIGADVNITYPKYEDVMGMHVYEDAISESVFTVYISIIEKAITPIIEYISSRINVRVEDKYIIGPDGSYLNTYTGRVSYGKEPTVATTLPNKILSLEYVRDTIPMGLPGLYTDLDEIVNMVRLFMLTLAHNLRVSKLTMTDYRKLINLSHMLTNDGAYEIDMDKIMQYLSDLADTTYALCNHAKHNTCTESTDIFTIPIKGYAIKSVSVPDISKLDPSFGLFIGFVDKEINVSTRYKNGTIFNILKMLVDTDKSGLYINIISNLRNGTYGNIGDRISEVLRDIGMLDLYLQPHDVVDTTVSDYLSNRLVDLYVSSDDTTDDMVYMLTEDIMYVGYLDNNILVISLLIHRLRDGVNQDTAKQGETTDLTNSLRFSRPPDVRKLTDETMKDFREVFYDEDYINIENTLKRHVG